MGEGLRGCEGETTFQVSIFCLQGLEHGVHLLEAFVLQGNLVQ
jgi:hypothetical protein